MNASRRLTLCAVAAAAAFQPARLGADQDQGRRHLHRAVITKAVAAFLLSEYCGMNPQQQKES